jgi:hypothetical protein
MVQQATGSASDLRTRLFGTYFLNHERMLWKLSDIAWDAIDRRKLDDLALAAVHATMLVESHNPVYASVLMRHLRLDIAATNFLAVWTYEESKHFSGLRTYLELTHTVSDAVLAAELEVTRAGEWEIPNYYTDLMIATYTMMQEHLTGIFYRNFAQRVDEPVLMQLLSLIGKDEFRHHRFYFEYAQRILAQDPSRVAEIDTALLEFQMPGPQFIPDYQHHALAMADAGDLGVNTYRDALGVVRKLVGEAYLHELAHRTGFRPRNSWLRHALRQVTAPGSDDPARVERNESRRRALLERARLDSN